jgi:hypothetical protein
MVSKELRVDERHYIHLLRGNTSSAISTTLAGSVHFTNCVKTVSIAHEMTIVDSGIQTRQHDRELFTIESIDLTSLVLVS